MPAENMYQLTTEEKPRILSLKILAANAISKANPSLFFTLHNKGMPPEIYDAYVNATIQQKVYEQVTLYKEKKQERHDNIDDCTERLSSSECFVKISSCTFSTMFSGLHVGTYFILKAAETAPSTQLTFICTIPVTFFLSLCVGMCLAKPAARAFAHCFIPPVSDHLTIDLNEIESNSVSKRP